MKKIGIMMDYNESWMMFLYEVTECSCRHTRYWNECENYFDDSYELMEVLADEIIEPKFKSYDEIQEWLEERSTSEFSLKLEHIDELRKMK